MIDFDTAVEQVRRQGPRMVAIDGLPVSGKSTLAGRLSDELGASVLYLDDFVRPESQWRGRAQPAFPFPYMRYNAFTRAVIDLAEGRAARFRPYDWAMKRLAADITVVHPGRLLVVEGGSALHPDLAGLYDLGLWVESDAATTLEASLARGVGD